MQTTAAAVTSNNPHKATLWGLLIRAMQAGYTVAPILAHDYISTRAERTRRGSIEAEIYEDGSGFEVAFLGYVFMLGVERRRGYAVRTTPSA